MALTGTFFLPARTNYNSTIGQVIVNWTCVPDKVNNKVGFRFEAFLEVSAESATFMMTPNDWMVYTTIDPKTSSYSSQLVSAVYSFRESYYANDIFCQDGAAKLVTLTKGTYSIGTTSTVYIGHGDDNHIGYFTNSFMFQQAVVSGNSYYTNPNLNFTFSDGLYTPVTTEIDPFVLIEGSEAMDRTSTITCPSTIIGQSAPIRIQKFSTNDTNTIYYSVPEVGISNTLIASKTSASIMYWTVPESIEDSLPSGTSSTECILTWNTYDNTGTKVGSGTFTFTLLTTTGIGLEKYPKFDPEFTVDNHGFNYTSYIIRYFSDVAVDPNATPESGTNTSVSITNGSQKKSGSYPATSSYNFSAVTSDEFTFYGTDKDGNENTYKYTYPNFIYYIPLSCRVKASTISATGNTTLTVYGDCFSGYFGNTPNKLTIQYRFSTERGQGDWQVATGDFALYNNSYGIDIDISGLDYTKQYYFEAKAWDLINITGVTSNIASSMTDPIFYWNNEAFMFNVPVFFNSGMGTGSGAEPFGLAPANISVVWDNESSFGRFIEYNGVITLVFYYQATVTSALETIPGTDVAPLAFAIEGVPLPRQYDDYGNEIKWYSGGGHCSGWTALQNNHSFNGWTLEYLDGHLCIVGRSQGPAAAGETGGSYYVSTKVGNTIYCSGTISYVMEDYS